MMTPHEIRETILKGNPEVVPQWIRDMCAADLSNLIEGGKLSSSTKEVSSSYLQFLAEQITLEPRGPEWTKILKRRVEVLTPFLEKNVTTVMISSDPRMATVRIDPEMKRIIDVEVD